MIDYFRTVSSRLLTHANFSTHRYLFNSFDTKSRLTGLVGPRGTGKTTLLLQYINNHANIKSQSIYLSLDHIYFTRTRLIDFINDLYEKEGVRYFFLDEVHKYPDWDQELKNIYDAYPDVYIVFSGSSSMDLIHSTFDLSRRGKLYHLEGMSFREFLEFKLNSSLKTTDLDTLLNSPGALASQLAEIPKIKGLFAEYLDSGYYPFYFQDEKNYQQKLLNIIDKTIYEDISHFYQLKTENLINLKKILSYVATIPPGQLNRNSISKHIRLDNKTVSNYLTILSETGLLCLVKENRAGSTLLKSTEKIYLDNPNLYQSITKELGFESQTGSVREIFFINMLINSSHKLFYSDIGDFLVNGHYFEIGGKNKTKKQIKTQLEKAYLVKDDILHPGANTIPLHLFGFLY